MKGLEGKRGEGNGDEEEPETRYGIRSDAEESSFSLPLNSWLVSRGGLISPAATTTAADVMKDEDGGLQDDVDSGYYLKFGGLSFYYVWINHKFLVVFNPTD